MTGRCCGIWVQNVEHCCTELNVFVNKRVRSCPTDEKWRLSLVSYRPALCIMFASSGNERGIDEECMKIQIENQTFKRSPTKIDACILSCLHVSAVSETQEGYRHLPFFGSSWSAVDMLQLKRRRRTPERTARERGKGRGGCLMGNSSWGDFKYRTEREGAVSGD